MPLLGRHKSLPAGANKQSNDAATRQPVCESPLFGTRRQLPISSPSPAARQQTTTNSTQGRSAAGKHLPQSATSHNLGSASLDSSKQQQQQQAVDTNQETLNSIPQQITSQQIHYAFSIMDTNSDGLIDLRDLSQMLANLGVPIDEAILSHVMSTVSKRGDHRISEKEFLNWIGEFIQVCDPKTTTTTTPSRTGRSPQADSATAKAASIVRSSTAGSSLAAHQPEVPGNTNLRQRRGSGSGLALMRSLSNSIGGGGGPEQQPHQEQSSQQQLARKKSTGKTGATSAPADNDETKNDLRAAFCVFDLDGDGFITLDEVQAGLKLLGESWTQKELNQVFSSCGKQKPPAKGKRQHDLDKQQRISIEDFVQLLL